MQEFEINFHHQQSLCSIGVKEGNATKTGLSLLGVVGGGIQTVKDIKAKDADAVIRGITGTAIDAQSTKDNIKKTIQ